MTSHLPFKPQPPLVELSAGKLAALSGFGRTLGAVWLFVGGVTVWEVATMAALMQISTGAEMGILAFNAVAVITALGSAGVLLKEHSWTPSWGRLTPWIAAAIVLSAMVASMTIMGAILLRPEIVATAVAGALLPAMIAITGLAVLMTTHAKAHFQKHLLRAGIPVVGTVEDVSTANTSQIDGRHWRRVQLSYCDTHGQRRRQSVVLRDLDTHPHPKKHEEIEILIDPQRSTDGFAPALYDIPRPSLEILDRRAAKPCPKPPEPWSGTPHEAALLSTLSPLPFNLWAALWLPCDALEIGRLSLDGASLRFEPKGDDATSIDLERPFTAHLSAHLLVDGRAELNVALQPRGARLSRPPVRFRTALPQSALWAHLPLKQELWPCLTPRDFAHIWPALRYTARLHGEDLVGVGDVSEHL